MRVSSKHLSLSSSVFRTLLKSGFQEGEALRTNGTVYLSLPDDDVKALSLIMKIIHAQNTQLPPVILLSTLASLAVLVDKYNFHESVTPWAAKWAGVLGPIDQDDICNELSGWIAISWVFKLPDLFAQATAVAGRNMSSKGIYDTRGGEELSQCLPIPESVTGSYYPHQV
jgi:hypothetical protein